MKRKLKSTAQTNNEKILIPETILWNATIKGRPSNINADKAPMAKAKATGVPIMTPNANTNIITNNPIKSLFIFNI